MEIRGLRVLAAAIDCFFDQPSLNRIAGYAGQFFFKALILETFCIPELPCQYGLHFREKTEYGATNSAPHQPN
jgi:hypothetical protein